MSEIRIAVVIPCYRERANILTTLQQIPAEVTYIYCIDDACPDDTGGMIEDTITDSRVRVLRHSHNTGVGGAVITGYKQALIDGADIIIKIDGDGQMDPSLIPRFITPITEGKADYTKGNRFFELHNLESMPKTRLFGNAVLSFFSKLSTGYWHIFDPTNGYTAIHANVLRLLPLEKIHQRYFFESDMLYRLSTVRAVVLDIPQRAIYGDEKSHLRISNSIPVFTFKHIRNFFSRIFYTYYLRDFHLASIEWFLGPVLLLFGLFFGLHHWTANAQLNTEASAGTVMLSALPFLVGIQLLLSAIGFDIKNQPEIPIHDRL